MQEAAHEMMDVFDAAIDFIRDNQAAWPAEKHLAGYRGHPLADHSGCAHRVEQPRARLRGGSSSWRNVQAGRPT